MIVEIDLKSKPWKIGIALDYVKVIVNLNGII